tara:strand:- start:264 stop:458 length:195 start_codon:yes stop_codon:yes gene_type:complete
MKIGDVIRIPAGAHQAFRMKSDVGMIVGTIPRDDKYPDDLEVLVDGIIHAMGFQMKTEVLSEGR